MRTLRLLFLLKERIDRRTYVFWGVTLMIVKYLGELLLYFLASGQPLGVFNFLSPVLQTRYPGYATLPDWFIPLIVFWSLPFIWIGVGMSIRRAADAALSPWLGILFFVPVVNYLLMLGLAAAPSSEKSRWSPQTMTRDYDRMMSPIALAFIFAICGTLIVWLSTSFFKLYATSLFVGAPLILGLVQGYLVALKRPKNYSAAISYVALTVLLIHLFLLLFALEGIICLAMSFPLAVTLGGIGATFGAGIASYGRTGFASPGFLLLALPVMPWAESMLLEPHKDVVLSVIEIDAAPEKVWPNVVKFSDLPPTTDWLFQLGVAHPLRARIEGEGVGAVRYCEFSTGAFVEPITAWEEPSRLAFNVKYQPQPMKEVSFYDQLDAPHLDGYFRSVRGEFKLIPVGNGKTRLEGRTWYEMDMQPGWYWQVYGRWFIHKIHLRVLAHIKDLSEPA